MRSLGILFVPGTNSMSIIAAPDTHALPAGCRCAYLAILFDIRTTVARKIALLVFDGNLSRDAPVFTLLFPAIVAVESGGNIITHTSVMTRCYARTVRVIAACQY